MKFLAIFLLILNVAYFAWQMNNRLDNIAEAREAPSQAMASDVRLVLLSELKELPPLLKEANGDNPINTGAKNPFEAAGSCKTIGPFISDQERTGIKNWLARRNQTVKERQEEQKTNERYWVYLAAKSSDEESQAQLQELKQKGVQDYYMISTGNMRNAISLGLFNTQRSVNRRLRELGKKGYNPVVIPQHKTTLVYWLDIHQTPTQADQNQNQQLPDLPEGINVINQECSEIALLHADQ